MRNRLFLEFGGFYDCGESGGFVDGEFGEDFAVKLNAGGLQASNQPAVGGAVKACCCVDTRVPQDAEGAFAVAAVAVGKL